MIFHEGDLIPEDIGDLIPEDIGDLTADNKYAHGSHCDCLKCIVIIRGTSSPGPS